MTHTRIGSAAGFELDIARRGACLIAGSYRGQAIMPSVDPLDHPLSAGDLLLPWPNRIRDGRWSLGSASGEVAINEPTRSNAIHGLVRELDFELLEHSAEHARLRARLEPSAAYPFALELAVEARTTVDALELTTELVNRSEERAPWAFGVHPYFGIDGLPASELELSLSASEVFDTDERLLPTGRRLVDPATDLRSPRPLAELELDHAFAALDPARPLATLRARDGRGLELYGDGSIRYLQVFTPRERGGELGAGGWVAIEPMTAPAEAFNSGEGVHWLEPGERASVHWAVRAVGDWG